MDNRGVAALLFHHIGPSRQGTHPSLTVQPRRFERFMRLLRDSGYTGVSSETWTAWRRGVGALPKRPVVLTFDDGYADLAQCALPVVARLNWGATVFVAAATVGGRGAWDEPEAAAHHILSAEEIRTWAGRGVEFGAHGATHCDLTRLDANTLRDEVLGGRDTLVELLGRPVTAFAYPYGSSNEEVRRLVASSFDVAFGIEEGLNDGETDLWWLRRTMVQTRDSTLDVLLRARFGWSPLQRVRARARVRERARRLSGHARRS